MRSFFLSLPLDAIAHRKYPIHRRNQNLATGTDIRGSQIETSGDGRCRRVDQLLNDKAFPTRSGHRVTQHGIKILQSKQCMDQAAVAQLDAACTGPHQPKYPCILSIYWKKYTVKCFDYSFQDVFSPTGPPPSSPDKSSAAAAGPARLPAGFAGMRQTGCELLRGAGTSQSPGPA